MIHKYQKKKRKERKPTYPKVSIEFKRKKERILTIINTRT